MRQIAWTVLAFAATCLGQCGSPASAQRLDHIQINLSQPGLPPEVYEAAGRWFEDFRKADKPCIDEIARALALRDTGDLKGAEGAARSAIALAVRDRGNLIRPDVYQLLGEILVREGKAKDGLREFDRWEEARTHDWMHAGLGHGMPSNDLAVRLDRALAYCVLGTRILAQKCYADPVVPPLPPPFTSFSDAAPEDAPSVRTFAGLKAAILLQMYLNHHSSTLTDKEQHRLISQAARLAPDSPLVAAALAERLESARNLPEALKFYRVGARGAGRLAGYDAEAVRRLESRLAGQVGPQGGANPPNQP